MSTLITRSYSTSHSHSLSRQLAHTLPEPDDDFNMYIRQGKGKEHVRASFEKPRICACLVDIKLPHVSAIEHHFKLGRGSVPTPPWRQVGVVKLGIGVKVAAEREVQEGLRKRGREGRVIEESRSETN